MKSRLNLSINKDVIFKIKIYAAKNHKSISSLVEEYFSGICKPQIEKNILQIVEELDSPKIDVNADLKDLYFLENAKRMGFKFLVF